MALLTDEATLHDCEMVYDEDLLDDSAPTRIAIDTRKKDLGSYHRRSAPEQWRVGELVGGKYRVERVHRRGPLGTTVEAIHVQLGQRVALRLSAADPSIHPEATAGFLRGVRAAVPFQNQHTARIIDVGTLDSGIPYVVSEYLSGSDLSRVLRVREALPVPEAVDYLLQACEGLAEAHAYGIVHKNLKPTNLFVTRRSHSRLLKVLDFGVSDDPLSDAAINGGGTSAAVRSLAYLAPEQIREPSTVDTRADIWALGAILHEMLAGTPLYEARTTPGLLAAIAADPPAPVSQVRPDIPAELESAILRCLSKDREDRYLSIAELASALKSFASSEGHDSVEKISRAFGRSGRTSSSLPPPLPGQPSRAIVRVEAPSPQQRLVNETPKRRMAEFALTAVGMVCAAVLGGFITIHSMEGALAAAVSTPHAVVADLSPALPAGAPLAAPQLPGQADLAPAAPTVASTATGSGAPIPAPQLYAPRAAPAASHSLPPIPPPTAQQHRAGLAKADTAERVAADAKREATGPAAPKGLFDDAN